MESIVQKMDNQMQRGEGGLKNNKSKTRSDKTESEAKRV